MTIVVSNSSPKITKQGFFGPKFCFFFFFEKFWSQTNSRVMISNMTIAFFKILAQKCPSNVFFVPNLDIFVCLFVCFCGEILQLDKFEDADFKYDNSFWKFQAKNSQIGIFGTKFRPFCFFPKILQLHKFEGADFKQDIICFNFQPKNNQIRLFWS